jgi:lysosomal acid lipase/cholesteryl ester hydrolase
MSFHEIVNLNGFRTETHKVRTEDGYLLSLYRIPGRTGEKKSRKPPILVQHGLVDCADTWVIRGNESVGISLALQGYDVWFGNSRGTTNSKEHISLDSNKDSEYWDFSFEELGEYDLPAVIEYMIDETDFEKIGYVSHSMGGT